MRVIRRVFSALAAHGRFMGMQSSHGSVMHILAYVACIAFCHRKGLKQSLPTKSGMTVSRQSHTGIGPMHSSSARDCSEKDL